MQQVSGVWERALCWRRSRFTVCGPDREGRSVMWVNGGLTREEDESRLIRTSCLMFLSCHADLHTLVRIFLAGIEAN